MRWPQLMRRAPARVEQVRHRPADPQAIVFPGYGGNVYGDTLGGVALNGLQLPGSKWDWAAEVRDPTLNYAVAGCLRWIADNIAEPALQVVRRQSDGELVPDQAHALLSLLEEPNPDYDGHSLLTAVAWDYAISGRAYLIKERNNLGQVMALWWVPWWTMAPRWETNSQEFIRDYVYRPDGRGEGEIKAKEDVIHFRWGLDALTGGRLGVHRTRPFLPAMAALNEGMVYTPSVLRNMGIVPNVLIIRGKVGDDAKKSLREWFTGLFIGDGRGRPGVLEVDPGGSGNTGGATLSDIKQLGLTPEQLALDKILNRPEIIVCNAFGIHPGVLYLGNAGGKGFDNGGQLEQARKASYHDCLGPMLKRFGRTLTFSLLGEYEDAPPSEVFCRWDFAEVEALQEDQKALYERLNRAVESGWMRVSEAREKARLSVDESDKVYLRKPGITAVSEASENPQPASEPLPLGEDDPDQDPDEQKQPEDEDPDRNKPGRNEPEDEDEE